jgi:hypothetical protein
MRSDAASRYACSALRPSGPVVAQVAALNPKYFQRWEVRLRGERIGEVLAATEQAACMRAIHRFHISRKEDQRELSVHLIEENGGTRWRPT